MGRYNIRKTIKIEEIPEAVKIFEQAGIDLLDISGSRSDWSWKKMEKRKS